jgi:hypothetical protein
MLMAKSELSELEIQIHKRSKTCLGEGKEWLWLVSDWLYVSHHHLADDVFMDSSQMRTIIRGSDLFGSTNSALRHFYI